MGRISITDIESLNYDGYIWMSDSEAPQILNQESFPQPTQVNPFIVEGQLYNEERGISYSIKYVDGQYLVQKYNVTAADLSNSDNEHKEYLGNLKDGRWLKFLRYWEEDQDDNCMGMPVLKLTKNVFIGFKK